MDIHDFLLADQLRLGKTGLGIERSLVRLTEDGALHEDMRGFDVSRHARIEAGVGHLRGVIGETLSAEAVAGLTQNQRNNVRGKHHGLVRRGFSKVREAVALADLAGSMEEPGDLFVHDVCAGKGIVAVYAARLRSLAGRNTAGICWELRTAQQSGHKWIKHLLGVPAQSIDFRSADIRDADLSAHPGLRTDRIAKHACGSLTDEVFGRVRALPPALRPGVTAVMTCCHALMAGQPMPWARGMEPQLRDELVLAADPRKHLDLSAPDVQQQEEEYAYERDVGLVCRRIIDTLRARELTAAGMPARVEEALPFGRDCMRNNVIVA